jgi:NodT family efflux transporter outer membrane factor (OMF) lipoprotein
MKSWLTIFTIVCVLSGCADDSGIALNSTMREPQSQNTQTQPAVFPAQQWWQSFGDTQLDALIAQAIEKNYSLKVVQSHMRAADALVASADSARYPELNLGAQSTREHLSANSIYPPPLGGNVVTMSSVRLAGQWQIDWFGKQRALLDAAIGASRAAEADMQAARVLLAATVATHYFNLARLQEQQQNKRQLLQHSEQQESLMAQRVAAGLDNTLTLHQIRALAPQLRRELAAIDEQIALARHALAELVGAEPHELDQLTAVLPNHRLHAVPDQLPAQLLGHRADVVAARWRVESELQGIKGARADFYPNLNLSAFAGLESIGLSQLLRSDSRTLGTGPALSLPVFDAGRLRAQLKGRTAQADAAIDSYNGAVLNALREVADNLASGRALQVQLAAQQVVTEQLSGASTLARQRYQAGLSNNFAVLLAEDALLLQQGALIDIQARSADAEVGLMQALGGGYASSEVSKQQGNNPDE